MLTYLKNPVLVFCVVCLVVYGLMTYYNKTQCENKTPFTSNEIYMYSLIIAVLASGILYFTTKTRKEIISETIPEKDNLHNRPLVENNINETDRKQFFDNIPKQSRKSAKPSHEKVLTEPFEQQ